MMLAIALSIAVTPDFDDQLKKAGDFYAGIKSKTTEALKRADLVAAEKTFLDALPEDKRTAAHDFVLGSMWFDMDRPFAYRMHQAAFALAPDEPRVQQEWAISLHCQGKWSEAEALYAKLVSDDEESAQTRQLLRTDCLLHLGKYAEAVACWPGKKQLKSKMHLGHVLSWVYGEEKPMAKRARLVPEIQAEKLDHAEELLLGDVYWQTEGLRYDVEDQYLDFDGRLVQEKLGSESLRSKDLAAVVDYLFIAWQQEFPRRDDSVPHETLAKSAAELGWVGATPRLPANDRVAEELVAALAREKIKTPDELIAMFEAELTRRAQLANNDGSAARALVNLGQRAKSPKLDEWKKLQKPDERLAKRALVADCITNHRPAIEPLVAQLLAEFAHGSAPDFGAIDKAFAALKDELEKKK
jgi:hypothetical protein